MIQKWSAQRKRKNSVRRDAFWKKCYATFTLSPRAPVSLPLLFSCTASCSSSQTRKISLSFSSPSRWKLTRYATRGSKLGEAWLSRDRSTHAKFTETGSSDAGGTYVRQLRRLVDVTCNRWGFFLRAATFQATTFPASSTAAQPRNCKGALVVVVVVYSASSVIAVNGSKPEFSRYEDHSECQITRRQPRQRAVSIFLRCCSTVDKLVKCFSAVIRGAESLQQTENHRGYYIYIYMERTSYSVFW